MKNGIHVPSFFGQKDDKALYTLMNFLKEISGSENISAAIDKRLGLEALYLKYKEEQPSVE